MSKSLADMAREYLAEASEDELQGQDSEPIVDEAGGGEDNDVRAGAVDEVDEPLEGGEPSVAGSHSKGEAAKSTVVRDYLRNSLKYDLGDDLGDDDLAPQIAAALREREEALQELRELRESAKRQEPVVPSPKPEAKEPSREPEKKASKWGRIDRDPDWEHAAEFDTEVGRWVGRKKFGDYGDEAARNLNAYAKEMRDRAERLTVDPMGVIREAGLDSVLEEIRNELRNEITSLREGTLQEFDSRTYERNVRANREADLAARRGEYFVLNESGDYMRDPITGDYRLTARGQAYAEAAREAQETYGIVDPDKIHRFAVGAAGRVALPEGKPEPPAKQPEAAEPAAGKGGEEKRKRFLDRGRAPSNRLTSREGTVRASSESGDPQNTGLSFKEMILSDPENADILGRYYKG